nr:DUF3892 domain-containing protein [uncultured Albidiferax sp.]
MSTNAFFISAVDYATGQTHIQHLKVHPKTPDGMVGTGIIKTRPEVIELIKKGASFTTITKKPGEPRWTIGAKLEVVPVTTEFLKTKKDSKMGDNLENLPQIK